MSEFKYAQQGWSTDDEGQYNEHQALNMDVEYEYGQEEGFTTYVVTHSKNTCHSCGGELRSSAENMGICTSEEPLWEEKPAKDNLPKRVQVPASVCQACIDWWLAQEVSKEKTSGTKEKKAEKKAVSSSRRTL